MNGPLSHINKSSKSRVHTYCDTYLHLRGGAIATKPGTPVPPPFCDTNLNDPDLFRSNAQRRAWGPGLNLASRNETFVCARLSNMGLMGRTESAAVMPSGSRFPGATYPAL